MRCDNTAKMRVTTHSRNSPPLQVHSRFLRGTYFEQIALGSSSETEASAVSERASDTRMVQYIRRGRSLAPKLVEVRSIRSTAIELIEPADERMTGEANELASEQASKLFSKANTKLIYNCTRGGILRPKTAEDSDSVNRASERGSNRPT